MRRREFLTTFSMLSPAAAERGFESLYEGSRPRHEDLCSIAADPAAGRSTDRCVICRFPTRSFHPQPERLEPEVVSLIHSEFPQWNPALGLCLQCADLYEARHAMAAERVA